MSAPRLFISHAAADRKIVEAFENLLSKMTGIPSSDIFVSSLEGQGVPKGDNFVDAIKDEVTRARAVVALISPAYLDSPFCMAELGAAWALGTHRFPVVVPPSTFADINATQLGLTAIKISDDGQLDQMMEDLNGVVGVARPKTGIRRRALKSFMGAWSELSATVGAAQRIEKAVHDNALGRVEKLEGELATADSDIRKLEEKVERLRTAKDRAEVDAIERDFADDNPEEQFDQLLSDVTDLEHELGGAAVLRHAIMDHYHRAGSIDWDNDKTEFETAIQHGVFDADNDDLIWSSSDLQELTRALKALDAFLGENGDAAFLTSSDRRGPSDIRFWDGRIR